MLKLSKITKQYTLGGSTINALPSGTREELVRGFQAADQMLDYLIEQTKGDQNLC